MVDKKEPELSNSELEEPNAVVSRILRTTFNAGGYKVNLNPSRESPIIKRVQEAQADFGSKIYEQHTDTLEEIICMLEDKAPDVPFYLEKKKRYGNTLGHHVLTLVDGTEIHVRTVRKIGRLGQLSYTCVAELLDAERLVKEKLKERVMKVEVG